MTPKRKIVIGFIICIVASLLASYAALFVALANMGGIVSMSGHNPRSDAAMVAAAIAPVVVFIIGGLKLAPAIRAASRSKGRAALGTFAFALFPVAMQLQLLPSGTPRISEFRIYIDGVDPDDWMIDRVGAPRGRITVLRAANSLFAHEEHTRETLRSDNTTITMPIVVTRMKPGVPLPRKVIMAFYARDPGFNNADLSFHYTLPLPLASASR